ncbi:MAG: hypothetical protein M0R51_09615 [Clostridia bacterium]|nr:hypothetical protein [Clostridia bacterium]
MVRLTEKQIADKIKFISDYKLAKNAATGSKLDANANVSCKNIATMSAEINKDINIQINRALLKTKITEMFGDDLGNEYIRQLESHEIYCHDETSLSPYCVSVSMYPFLLEGLKPMGGDSIAPKNIKSFVGSFVNLIFALSSQFSGACNSYNQTLIYNKNGVSKSAKFGDFVNSFELNEFFNNLQGDWQYKNISNLGYKVVEDGKFVDIKKVYKRTYNKKIYKVSTKTGYSIEVSEDHIFKTLFRGRNIEVKAKDLLINDTVYMNKDFSLYIDKNHDDFKKGFLIGIICGDGGLTNHPNVTLSVNYKQEYIGDITNNYLSHFNLPTLNKGNGNRCFSYHKHSKELYDFFKLYIEGSNTYDKHIITADKSLEFLTGFLDGLFTADGSYSENRGIAITLSNFKLLENIEDILSKLYIPFNEHKKYLAKGNRQPYGVLYVPKSILKYLDICLNKKLKSKRNVIEKDYKHLYYYGKHAFKNAKSNCINSTMLKTNSNQEKEYLTDVIHSIELIDNPTEFVYEIETSTGWYNDGGFITHNCSTPEFLLCFNHFAEKSFGKEYLTTHKKEIEQELQGVVYAINQPASSRNYQSCFWNIALFDQYYFESIFGNFVFPDGTQPDYNSLAKLQEFFMTWFNNERTKALLTFPVVTAAILSDGDKPKDDGFAQFLSKQLSDGNSFFIYNSDKADSLSSCCFDGKQKILIKNSDNVLNISFEDFYNSKYDFKKNYTIFHNGSWAKGNIIKLKSNSLYKITTTNNKEIFVTSDHYNPTFDGDKFTKDLTENDYLLFNTRALNTFPEKDMKLTYEQGVLIGAYLGDGSKDGNKEIRLSTNVEKYSNLIKYLNKAIIDCGLDFEFTLHKPFNNVYPLYAYSEELFDFISYWVYGQYCNEKDINLNCLTQSLEFRKGIIDGLYMTDGGNSNRIYSTSEKMINSVEIILNSLGLISVINSSDRRDEKVIIRNKEYNRNFITRCIRWYSPNNKRTMKDIYKVKNNSTFFKIKSIELISNLEQDVYCFQMDNKEEPYFTLPNGIITGNCRLRNELTDNSFSSTLGSAGVATGSINVITLNVNSLVQENRDLKTEIEKLHKYQVAYKSIIDDFYNHDLLPVYKAGFISLKKQFLTIGLNGIVEAAEYLGYEISNNDDYKNWLSDLLKIVYDSNKDANKIYHCMFNAEIIPAESLGVKNAAWDKKKGLKVNRDCYNSYFYKVDDHKISIIDKFHLHGKKILQYLDGGSALHLNLEEHPTQEAYYKLICLAIKTGCNYFTTNVKITICNTCENIDKRTLKECPKCGSHDLDEAVRIIGYLKRISSFSEARQLEASKRIYHSSTTK